MSPKEIIFSPQAERDIKDLSKQEQKTVLESLKKWASGEYKPELEKIKSQPAFYRLKAAHLRIIYYPLGSCQRVLLLLIRDRKSAYRGLGDLSQKLTTAVQKLKIAKPGR